MACESFSAGEALTRQFYDWEMRGRGWQVSCRPVALEPPFRPFFGHFVHGPPGAVIDDGRKPTALSSFFDGLFKTPGALSSARNPPDEPIFWLLWLLTISVGFPFVLLSSTGPLVQRWFAGSGNPYLLYAASNLGSGATRPGLAAINVGTSAALRVMREGKEATAPFKMEVNSSIVLTTRRGSARGGCPIATFAPSPSIASRRALS